MYGQFLCELWFIFACFEFFLYIFLDRRVCDIWNSLRNFVVEASSTDNFRRRLNQVDLSKSVVLQRLCLYYLHSFSLCWACISG